MWVFGILRKAIFLACLHASVCVVALRMDVDSSEQSCFHRLTSRFRGKKPEPLWLTDKTAQNPDSFEDSLGPHTFNIHDGPDPLQSSFQANSSFARSSFSNALSMNPKDPYALAHEKRLPKQEKVSSHSEAEEAAANPAGEDYRRYVEELDPLLAKYPMVKQKYRAVDSLTMKPGIYIAKHKGLHDELQKMADTVHDNISEDWKTIENKPWTEDKKGKAALLDMKNRLRFDVSTRMQTFHKAVEARLNWHEFDESHYDEYYKVVQGRTNFGTHLDNEKPHLEKYDSENENTNLNKHKWFRK